MQEEGKFIIAWEQFSYSLSNILSNVRNDPAFSDITLVTDDQQMFHTHRFILAGCSEFFNTILKKSSSSHPNPWFYLNGINSDLLKLLLDFIYLGKVQIDKNSLDEFMQIATKLKIEGLVEQKRFDEDKKVSDDLPILKKEDLFYNTDILNTDTANDDEKDEEHDDNLSENILRDLKTAMGAKEEGEVTKLTEESKQIVIEEPNKIVTDGNLEKPPKIYCYEKITLGNISEVKPKVEELTEKIDGGWRCKFCGFVKKGSGSNKKQELGYHIESHFVGLTYACKLCPKTFKTRNSERKHKYRDHKQI